VSKNNSASAPNPLIAEGVAATGAAAQQNGANWLNAAQAQYNTSQANMPAINAAATGNATSDAAAQTNANTNAATEQGQANSTIPTENSFINAANNWGGAANQAKVANAAGANVQEQAASQQQQTNAALTAEGANPNSGAAIAANRAAAEQTALGTAGAMNNADNTVQTQALGLEAQAVGMGNTNAGLANQDTGVGIAAGNAGEGALTAANAAGNSNFGVLNSGYAGQAQGDATMMNGLQQLYGDQTQAYNTQTQQNNANTAGIFGGLGSIAGGLWGTNLGGTNGTVGGSIINYLSDKTKKEQKSKARGTLEALRKMPIDNWKYKKGVADEGHHIGTYAQDFKKATGKGDGKSINIMDAMGVTMGAVKELADKVDKIGGRGPAIKQGRPNPRPQGVMGLAA